jgi:predicted amidohydrolase YtcJ
MTPATSSISSPSKPLLRRLATLAVGAATLLAAGAAPAADRTIFYNGKIFTADPAKPWAQALAVKGKEIEAVGSDAEILPTAGKKAQLVDLKGRTVVPGINDAHVHALPTPGVYVNAPDFIPFGPGPALADVLSILDGATAAYPAGTWLIVRVGTAITDDPTVTRFALDAHSPNHPVKLEVWTGHGTYLNTNALQTLGISDTEPDPFGGSFERVPGSQTITGVAHEYAEYRIRRRMFASMPDEQAVGFYKQYFANEALRLGFTSIQDMAIGISHERILKILKAADMPIRVRAICFPMNVDEPCKFSDEGLDAYPRIKASGTKWISDGTPIERLSFLNEPYADAPGHFGTFNLGGNPLEKILFRGLLGVPRKHQMLFHSVGDGAIDRILDALENTGGEEVWEDRRTRIEHGDLLLPENYQRAAELGVVVVQNPTHLSLGPIFDQRFTPALLPQIQPLRSLLTHGIPVALGTDSIGHVSSPWLDIFLAMVHPDQPSEAISLSDALRAYTMGSAYAEFEENKKGSLTPGKFADFAVLSQDVFSLSGFAFYNLPNTVSLLTVVDGQTAYADPAGL